MYESSRLTLRNATIADAPFIYELLNSRGWLENIGDRGISTVSDARLFIEDKYLPHYEKHGYGVRIVINKEGLPIGIVGLFTRPGLDIPDLGFAFLDAYQGMGYATEAGQLILDYETAHYGINRLCAIAIPQNEKSIKVLIKLGFHYEKEIILPGDTAILQYFTWSAPALATQDTTN